MADPFEPNPQDADDDLTPEAPYGQEPMEVEDSPRRAASARFIVDAEVGSEAALRDAMDPANQSLADALRLSFRVLQLVIVVLIALFMVSSFKTVKDDQSGVFTRWGRIINLDSTEALEPGLKWGRWPYPIGEFVLFGIQNRTANVTTAFMPRERPGVTREQMVESADVSTPLFPGQDGSLLTRDADLSHMRLIARYEIVDPSEFVRHIDDGSRTRDADAIVRLAVQRAAIHVTATIGLQDLVDMTEDTRGRMHQSAQKLLDDMSSGIRLAHLEVRDPSPPFAIVKVFANVTSAIQAAGVQTDEAVQRAKKLLTEVAGGQADMIIQLIEQYEESLDKADNERSAALLAEINAALEGPEAAGEVSQIIGSARSYQDQIESTLGNEVRRFESFLPTYRENPDLFVRKQWMDVFSEVLRRKDVEVIYVPPMVASLQMHITGSYLVLDIRRKAYLKRREEATYRAGYDPTRPYINRAEDMTIQGPGRQLKVEDGKVKGLGQK
jgi:modulator of FtsH protease HflK